MRQVPIHARSVVLALVIAAGVLVPLAAAPASAASTFTVNTAAADTNDGACNTSPNCTLREAIIAANATPASDTIQFALGSGTPVINVGSGGLGALPAITQPVTIKGATGGATRVELGGAGAGASADGLDVQSGNSTISKLVIGGFSLAGIELETNGSNVVKGCWIGLDAGGAASNPNRFGVWASGSSNNLIGGTTAGDRNVLSGNTGVGVFLYNVSNSNTVEGNYLGTNAAGTAAIGNQAGIEVDVGIGNAIGGTTAGAGNLISGNTSEGVEIVDAETLTTTLDNVVQGNLIGTDKTGTTAIANGIGVQQEAAASATTIGGTTAAARNVISSNLHDGVNIATQPPFDGNTDVLGNYVGTNAAGTAALPNGDAGVHIGGSMHNDVGGTAAGSGNLISGNHDAGVLIDNPYESTADTNLNRVRGNLIGTNAAGTSAIANGYGVEIDGQRGNTIGGTTASAGNVISGNAVGIGLTDNAVANTIQGNEIGTDASGNPLPNQSDGIGIQDGSFNTIGGTAAGAGNVIANNGPSIVGGDGIFVEAGRGNTFEENSIYDNTLLGIDLGEDGVVTPNDADDADTGPNDLQNFPVVSLAKAGASTTHVTGTLESLPRTTFRVELFSNPTCDPSGNGEGKKFLTATSVSTDHTGNGSFDVTVSGALATKLRVTATATDPLGNTSEFSACKKVST